jgi:transcriptional regulator with XRE-family HTH domain
LRDFSVSERSQKTDILRALGQAVRERREQLSLTQAELASAMGVKAQRISALERGRINIRYELLLALADSLDVQSATLVMRAEELAREDPR